MKRLKLQKFHRIKEDGREIGIRIKTNNNNLPRLTMQVLQIKRSIKDPNHSAINVLITTMDLAQQNVVVVTNLAIK